MRKFDSNCTEGYANYLKGLYFGILKDCEKNKDYERLIDSALEELIGLLDVKDSINLNKLFVKTASLRYLKYKYLRETIINSCMPLVDTIFKED